MKLYLIRHALSVSNDLCLWTGQQNSDLSESGVKSQAEIMARYSYPEADIYISSPLLRCTRSLRLIYGREPDILLPELSECALGILEGRPYTNLNDDPDYLAWINEPDKAVPDGESFNNFTERARSGFIKMIETARSQNAYRIAAMMHGNVMRAILHSFVDSSIPHSCWKIPNGGVYAIELDMKGRHVIKWDYAPEFLFASKE